MLDQVMEAFDIQPDYNLSIMRDNQTLSMITSAVLVGMDEILIKEMPDMVLIHGDTTTSFGAALTAFYRNIPVGHVEAGLRTYNLKSPYPEEFNRQAVDIMCDLYFAPTEGSKENLLKEGKPENKIFVTGNTVIDALQTTVKDNYTDENLSWAKGSKLILMTAHRRENIGAPMHEMFRAIRKIIDDNENVKLIYPIHKNPKVREIANQYFLNHERIRLIEPLEVFDFHNYIKQSYLILTDSGGIQEEAPSLGKPVLVMRETTERPEGVAAGTLRLVGTCDETIYTEATKLLNNEKEYKKMSMASNPYGDGHASERIVEIIKKYVKG
jgi:UDP-N-acetylglucosamine 2-epimerase (non-hydrolysing)